MTLSKFLQLIEATSDQQIVKDRYLFNDLLFSYPFKMDQQQIQFQLTGDFFLSSLKPLKPLTNVSTRKISIPDLKPLEPTISILKQNIYKIENIYRKYANFFSLVGYSLHSV